MKIVLTEQESEKFFHNALCNGMSELGLCDLELDFTKQDYKKAQQTLKAKIKAGQIPHEMYVSKNSDPHICFEDVLMEILRNGGKLKMIHHDGGTWTRSITLADVHERVQKTDTRWLLEMENNEDDATTAFEVLQMTFFQESVFG